MSNENCQHVYIYMGEHKPYCSNCGSSNPKYVTPTHKTGQGRYNMFSDCNGNTLSIKDMKRL